MALTKIDLVDQITRIIGEDYDPRMDADRIIDQAGRFLFGMHSWRWRLRPEATLGFVADQEYVDLPSDFGYNGEIVDLTMADTIAYDVTLTTMEEISHFRQTTILSPTFYYAAVEYPTQSSTSVSALVPRLAWYPTPASTDATAVECIYRAGWTTMSNQSDTVNIPDHMDYLLTRLIRVFATTEASDIDDVLERLLKSAWVEQLKRNDGAQQADTGYVQGGMLSYSNAGRTNWNFTTVAPS